MKNLFSLHHSPATAANLIKSTPTESTTAFHSDSKQHFQDVPLVHVQTARHELHESINRLESLIATMHELREQAAKLASTSRIFAKQIKEYAKSIQISEPICGCLIGCSGFYDEYSRAEMKYSRSINRDFELLNSSAKTYFKKIESLEKKHDSKVADLDKNMKKIMPTYEKKAKKKSPEHDKYIKSLSELGQQISDAKKELASTSFHKEAEMKRMVTRVLASNCENRFATSYEQMKKCGPNINTIHIWSPFAVENAPEPPKEISDDNAEEMGRGKNKTVTVEAEDINNQPPRSILLSKDHNFLLNNEVNRNISFRNAISNGGKSGSVYTASIPPPIIHRTLERTQTGRSMSTSAIPDEPLSKTTQRHISLPPPGSIKMPEPWIPTSNAASRNGFHEQRPSGIHAIREESVSIHSEGYMPIHPAG